MQASPQTRRRVSQAAREIQAYLESQADRPVTAIQIAQATGHSRSTVYRVLGRAPFAPQEEDEAPHLRPVKRAKPRLNGARPKSLSGAPQIRLYHYTATTCDASEEAYSVLSGAQMGRKWGANGAPQIRTWGAPVWCLMIGLDGVRSGLARVQSRGRARARARVQSRGRACASGRALGFITLSEVLAKKIQEKTKTKTQIPRPGLPLAPHAHVQAHAREEEAFAPGESDVAAPGRSMGSQENFTQTLQANDPSRLIDAQGASPRDASVAALRQRLAERVQKPAPEAPESPTGVPEMPASRSDHFEPGKPYQRLYRDLNVHWRRCPSDYFDAVLAWEHATRALGLDPVAIQGWDPATQCLRRERGESFTGDPSYRYKTSEPPKPAPVAPAGVHEVGEEKGRSVWNASLVRNGWKPVQIDFERMEVVYERSVGEDIEARIERFAPKSIQDSIDEWPDDPDLASAPLAFRRTVAVARSLEVGDQESETTDGLRPGFSDDLREAWAVNKPLRHWFGKVSERKWEEAVLVVAATADRNKHNVPYLIGVAKRMDESASKGDAWARGGRAHIGRFEAAFQPKIKD